jgi:hypothetical protein
VSTGNYHRRDVVISLLYYNNVYDNNVYDIGELPVSCRSSLRLRAVLLAIDSTGRWAQTSAEQDETSLTADINQTSEGAR